MTIDGPLRTLHPRMTAQLRRRGFPLLWRCRQGWHFCRHRRAALVRAPSQASGTGYLRHLLTFNRSTLKADKCQHADAVHALNDGSGYTLAGGRAMHAQEAPHEGGAWSARGASAENRTKMARARTLAAAEDFPAASAPLAGMSCIPRAAVSIT